MKKAVKFIGMLLALIAVVFVGLLAYLTLREYRPAAIEEITPIRSQKVLAKNEQLSVLIYNIGYGSLGDQADFFMDGGKNVQPKSKAIVEENLAGIADTLKKTPADIYLLQEVDRKSKRSYRINQEAYLQEQLDRNSFFAYNFKVDYVPYPFPPIGHVESGMATMTDLDVTAAKRIALPVPFKWPVRTSNLKRGLLETRLPIKDSDRELVVINLHLEAYDDGEGKIVQTKKLAEILEAEAKKGNYVIVGGDFNQTFEGSRDFPKVLKDGWTPGKMLAADLPENFSFAYDDTYATSRLLNEAYTGDYETAPVFVIDGFIVSNNLHVENIEVINEEFKYADHHPVLLEVSFQ